jgi:hypothetical protein
MLTGRIILAASVNRYRPGKGPAPLVISGISAISSVGSILGGLSALYLRNASAASRKVWE